MRSLILNCYYKDIHSSGPGAVFNQENVDQSIISCTFEQCTTDSFAACFYFRFSTISIHNSCFFRCQALSGLDETYGNAFYIENSISASYQQLSAYFCGYDPSKVCDSCMATSKTPLNADTINSSYCASRLGSSSIQMYNSPNRDSVTFLTVISPWSQSSQPTVMTLFQSRADVKYFNAIDCINVTCMFFLSYQNSLTITNGVFINPGSSFVVDGDSTKISLSNCTSNVQLPVSSGYSIISSPAVFLDRLIIAEHCNFIMSFDILQNEKLWYLLYAFAISEAID